MSSEYLCKECKHSFRTIGSFLTFGSSTYAWKCRKSYMSDQVEHDPVTGPKKIKAAYETCSVSRIGNEKFTSLASNRCGEDARFWEPKNKDGLFKFIKKVAV